MTRFCLMFCHQAVSACVPLRGKRNGARSFSVSCNVSRGPVFFARPTENERMMMWRNCCVGSIFIFYLGWNSWVQCFWAFRILPQEYRCSVHIPLSNAPLTPFALLRGVSKSGAREQNADSITLDLFGEQKTRAASTRPIKAHQGPTSPVPDRAAMAAVGVNHPAPLNVDLKTPVDVAWRGSWHKFPSLGLFFPTFWWFNWHLTPDGDVDGGKIRNHVDERDGRCSFGQKKKRILFSAGFSNMILEYFRPFWVCNFWNLSFALTGAGECSNWCERHWLGPADLCSSGNDGLQRDWATPLYEHFQETRWSNSPFPAGESENPTNASGIPKAGTLFQCHQTWQNPAIVPWDFPSKLHLHWLLGLPS